MIKLLFSIIFILTLSGCYQSEPEPDFPLQTTYWSLAKMHDEDIMHFEQQPRIHIVFHLNDSSLHGSDGCNRINASYTQTKDTFIITKIASTRMICQAGMDQADDFLQVLSKVNKIQIKENNLIFFHADIELARFEANEDY